MSYTTTISVQCDGIDKLTGPFPRDTTCRAQMTLTRRNLGGMTASYAADIIEKNGWWARVDGKNKSTPRVAFCPRHIPADGREAARIARASTAMRESDKRASKPKEKS